MSQTCVPRGRSVRSYAQSTPAIDKVTAACLKATENGSPITNAYLQEETGMAKDCVYHTIKRMKNNGIWRWVLVYAKPGPPKALRAAKPLREILRDPYEGGPTPRQIAMRSYRMLRRSCGLDAVEARRRVTAKVLRYGL
jgi:DNA-binding Lrp family transcriptional regulator